MTVRLAFRVDIERTKSRNQLGQRIQHGTGLAIACLVLELVNFC